MIPAAPPWASHAASPPLGLHRTYTGMLHQGCEGYMRCFAKAVLGYTSRARAASAGTGSVTVLNTSSLLAYVRLLSLKRRKRNIYAFEQCSRSLCAQKQPDGEGTAPPVRLMLTGIQRHMC